MAKIETTFIRPKERYTPETRETKVVYDGYQNNPHELVVEENLEGEVSEIVNDTFVPNEGGNVVFTDNNETEHELITEDGFAGALDAAMPTALAKAQVIENTWQELKDKRDNGQLIPGSLYRITDYNCTTTQENTQSAGHQFDIVLLALSANKLAEEGWAMMHDNIYDVTFDGGVKKCYIFAHEVDGETVFNIVDIGTMLGVQTAEDETVIDEDNKSATCYMEIEELAVPDLTYNYFQNSNLSAWKVWYCLDNDKSRFVWADDSVDEDIDAFITFTDKGKSCKAVRQPEDDEPHFYAWRVVEGAGTGSNRFTNSLTPDVGDTIYNANKVPLNFTVSSFTPAHEGTGLPNGRGVIYRLIDEFNNDIKYDFKNIQFKRTITDGQYDANGTETWCYTLNLWHNDMCQDASIVGNTMPNDEGYIEGVCDNNFGYATAYDFGIEGVSTFAFALGNNVVLSYYVDYYYGIYSNTIGNNFYSNTIGNSFYSNTIGNSFYSNTIGNFFTGNMIGNSFYNKTISDNTSDKNYGNKGVELATKE